MSFRPRDVYVVDAVRTPIGRYNGALSQVRPDDLAAHAIRALLARTPELDPGRIGDVVLGNANGAGEENRNVGRMAALLAGLSVTVPGVTVNRLCASGLEAVVQAARAIALGDHSLVVAGGVESMTRAPYVLPKSDRAFPAGHTEMFSTTLGWRMVNPKMDPQWTVPLGESAELIAEKHSLSREQQDEFALASHRKASGARAAGLFDEEIVPLTIPRRKGDPLVVDRDECIRDDASPHGPWPSSVRRSARRTAPSPRAIPRRSTTGQPRFCSPTRRGCGPPAASRWPGSRPRRCPPTSRSTSVSRPSRP